MNKKTCQKILYRFYKKNPNPKIELIFHSQFELLISVILSSQSSDVQVNLVTKKLYSIANTPEKMLSLGKDKIKEIINKIGLYNKKTEYIWKTSYILLKKYKGKVPNRRIDLESLPGVGRKTANVILNTAFGYPTIAVDTHVFRVSNRIGLAKGKSVLQVEKQLLKIVPKKLKHRFHNWFVLHGRYICLSRNPKCKICFISDLCNSKNIN